MLSNVHLAPSDDEDLYSGFGNEEVAPALQTEDLEFDEGFQVKCYHNFEITDKKSSSFSGRPPHQPWSSPSGHLLRSGGRSGRGSGDRRRRRGETGHGREDGYGVGAEGRHRDGIISGREAGDR